MKKCLKSMVFAIACFSWLEMHAQDSLLDMIDSQDKDEGISYASATFKGTRLISTHTIETRGKGSLDLVFMHRFGKINSGIYNLYGLDEAWVRIAAEYALSDKITIGLGRSSYEKTYDGFIKYRALRQSSGVKNMPFSMTAVATMAINTTRANQPATEVKFSSRVAYNYQLLIARKINQKLSAQLSPTLIHHNLAQSASEKNDKFSLGLGARYKFTRRMAVIAEYYHQFEASTSGPAKTYNPLGLGWEIETGGHVFQLIFSNSQAMIEPPYITRTTGNIFDGDIHFGFNIFRTFQVGGSR